ncbi:glycosyltransferase [Longimycelium tulufanense]|nr:glycosyltransferase family 2 protein [Longimycelium tulufanense]
MAAVVSYQSAAHLPNLIASMPAGFEGVSRWRLVVADNGSTDGSADVVRSLAPESVVVDMGGNLGYAAGINACAALADPDEALLVLNTDVVLEPGMVRTLLDACERDDSIGVAVPEIRRPDGSAEPTLQRRPTPLRTLTGPALGRYVPALGSEMPEDARWADWAWGAILLVPAQVRRVVGPWRDDLFLYWEETDYCRRVTDAGWRVRRVPDARAVHRGGHRKRSPSLWAQLVTNRVVHTARWDGRRATILTWSALALRQLLLMPLGRQIHRQALAALWTGRQLLLRGEPTHPAAPTEFLSQPNRSLS